VTLQTLHKDQLYQKGDRVNKQTWRTNDINAEGEDSPIRQPTTDPLPQYEPLRIATDEHGKYSTIVCVRNNIVLNTVVDQ